MRVRSITVTFVAAVMLCAVTDVRAQQAPPARTAGRPKIGVVLGGGGALGISHVGVLRVLEELHIPIDYVAGTSMGSIVGGLYAAGMSPEEIGTALAAIDWSDALKDKPQREDQSFRRKLETDRYLLGFEMGVGLDGFKLPRGAVAGQKLNYLLQTMAINTATIDDFDKLPIPFRCVGTDIRTGEAVVLSGGNLAVAMRASMAVPGVFTPIEIDGRLLVDGGLVKNMPVDVVKAMGADIVIAVDVVGSEFADVKVENMSDLLARSYSIIKRPMEVEQLRKADFVVVPQLQGMTSGEFFRTPEFVTRGEAAARAMAERLRPLGVAEDDYRAFIEKQRRKPVPAAGIRIREIRVTGNQHVDTREILAAIQSRSGSRGNAKTVMEDINRIFGLGDFEKATYSLVPAGDAFDLVYTVHEKPWGPNYLHYGLMLETDFQQSSTFKFLVNMTMTRLNALGGELNTDLVLSNLWSLSSEFFQPLGFSNRLFVAPSVLLKNDLLYIYRQGTDVVSAEYRARTLKGALDVGSQFGSYGELRLGVEGGWLGGKVLSGESDLPEDTLGVGKWHTRLTIDRLDKLRFAREGYYLNLAGALGREYLGNETDSKSLAGVYRHAFSLGHSLVNVVLRGGTSFGSDLPVYDQFTLGGLESFGGYRQQQLRGPYMAAARLTYLYQIGNLAQGSGKGLYAGVLADLGNAWQTTGEIGADNLRYGGTAVMAMDSVIGPIIVGFGVAKGGFMNLYLTLGGTL